MILSGQGRGHAGEFQYLRGREFIGMGIYDDDLWSRSYKLGPFKLARTMKPYPEVPLFKFFYDTAVRYSGRSACIYLGRKITWGELQTYVDKLATALAAFHIKKGDKVATILPTSPQFIIADYAIQRIGAVHVPCSLLHKEGELTYEIGESGAETVICLDTSLDLVAAIREKTKLQRTIVTALKDFSSNETDVKGAAGILRLREVISRAEARPPPVRIHPREDLAALPFTGGSTGTPKGVMLTHYNLTCNTLQGLPWALGPLEKGIKGRASMLITLPAFHIYGHWCVRACVYWGLQMLLNPEPRDYDSIVRFLKNYRPFMAGFVPTQYMKLVERKIGRTNTSFTSGAAPLPAEVAKAFRKETGMPITEAYGLTETGPLTHFNLSTFSKITGFVPVEKAESIGVPVADTEAKILDPLSSQEVSLGEVGELHVRGPQVMKGYWPTPGSGLQDGWLATGDMCRSDDDGYFFLVDRDKDMINVSGFKVYSTTVDSVLFEHSAISQAVTIGIPDTERAGSERVKAFIVLKDDYKGRVGTSEILEFCKQRLAPYAVPTSVEFRDLLPMTVSQKLFKRALREEEMAKMTKM